MYIIINKTKNETLTHHGNWCGEYLKKLIEKGEDFVVISLYSNTLKLFDGYSKEFTDYDGNPLVIWKEYNLDDAVKLIKI